MRGISSGWERAASAACKAVRSPHSLPKARWDTTPVEVSSSTPPSANRSAEAMAHGVGSSSTRSAPQRTAISARACLCATAASPRWTKLPLMAHTRGASYCRRRPSSIRAWPRWKGSYSHMIPMAFTMFPLKMLQKVTIQLRDARICGNFSGFNGEINNLSGIYEILPESYHTSADFATEHLGVAFFRRCDTIGPTDK